MLRDVFYFGNKPNAHPREKQALNLADAKQQCTTDHFWVINEYCDYRKFDWEFDFEFLPDEDVWAEEHINVWPSQHQKDSGTWLCNATNELPLTIYRADVDPVRRRNEKSNTWVILDLIDESKFDFSWHPDPTDPPYIYKWGCKFYPAQLKSVLEYHVKNAINIKYMDEVIDLLPELDKWVEVQSIDKTKFDLSWRPDPREPAYIYVWGNKHIPAALQSTLEYHVSGATEKKYMSELIDVLPNLDKWVEVQSIDKTKFDLSWRPDPTSPPYIYTWGNKYISAELHPTLEYNVEGATERKYMSELVQVLPEFNRWTEYQLIDRTKFDLSWRPDPREPAYIYVWGNKYDSAEIKPTLEYTYPGATERKYMNIVDLEPEWDRWQEIQPIDKSKFDFSWRPDPNLHEPPYIYVWGNKHISAELQSTIEYHVPGATEYKYMSELVEVLPEFNRWVEIQPIDRTKFDLSWRSDPREPAFIYVWGNKHIPGELQSTLEYHVPGATEKKYMSELVEVLPQSERWKTIQEVKTFDFTWRPDPREPAFIYVWGNKHIPGELQSTLEYHVPGATEKKYLGEVDVLPEWNRYQILIPVDNDSFDFTWRPDPREPAFIYVWGNKYIPSELQSTIEYHVPGATEKKYMKELVQVLPELDKWVEVQSIDKTKFDLSWRPDPREPAFIYVWGNKHISAELQSTIEYHVPGATEKKYMSELVEVLPELDKWVETQSIDKTKFDLSWRPDPREPAFIYIWGNKHISAELQSTIEYHVPGATEKKYMSELVEVLPESDRWIETQAIDRTKFDLSWRPDPREPAYIYVWGNKYDPAEVKSTIEYHAPGAIDKKYMGIVDLAPQWDRWKEVQLVNKSSFDFRWRPDPNLHEPPYIYVWGNKHI